TKTTEKKLQIFITTYKKIFCLKKNKYFFSIHFKKSNFFTVKAYSQFFKVFAIEKKMKVLAMFLKETLLQERDIHSSFPSNIISFFYNFFEVKTHFIKTAKKNKKGEKFCKRPTRNQEAIQKKKKKQATKINNKKEQTLIQ
ncbi:hypothetical protein RFI_38837, partial [Reticulomyxa filosa]